jgi:alpha-tubulin suppressor-like RCC1 family protein
MVALRADGSVWAWGWNRSGQLGDGTHLSRITPRPVLRVHDITNVEAGYGHVSVLGSDGKVWAWGTNEHGEVGREPSRRKLKPIRVRGLHDVSQVDAGGEHTVAVAAA